MSIVARATQCAASAVRRGLCSPPEANGWLAEMIDHNYRSPVTDLTPLLEQD
jgi:hypothetical protein